MMHISTESNLAQSKYNTAVLLEAESLRKLTFGSFSVLVQANTASTQMIEVSMKNYSGT